MMDDAAGKTGTVSLTTKGVKTPDNVRDEAFRVWLSNGRSWLAAARRLGCDEKTLRRWGKDGDWEGRRRDELASSLPGMRIETAVSLTLSAYDAAVRLQQIAYDAAHNGITPDTKEVQALTLIVDRGGYAPVGSNRPALPDMASAGDTTSPLVVQELTRQQLIDRERLRRQQRTTRQD